MTVARTLEPYLDERTKVSMRSHVTFRVGGVHALTSAVDGIARQKRAGPPKPAAPTGDKNFRNALREPCGRGPASINLRTIPIYTARSSMKVMAYDRRPAEVRA
jgi:hypothetical protein